MNIEEKIAELFLKSRNLGEVIFEPDGNIPPDFSLQDSIGVETRRLNQHFFSKEKPIGLESLSVTMWDIFIEVLRSFDTYYQGESFWVSIDFERPLGVSMKKLKVQMKNALVAFLREKPNLPHEVEVNEQVRFYIFQSQPEEGEIFREASSLDMNAGGFVLSIYIENIKHCIKEKNLKINLVIHNYSKWWLILVDMMSGDLVNKDVSKALECITELRNFEKIYILNRKGRLLAER